MKIKQVYYGLVVCVVIILCFNVLLRLILHSSISSQWTSVLKDFLALFIIIVETINAKLIYKTASLVAVFLGLIGFTFVIMHWPIGIVLFCGSFFVALIFLFIHAWNSEIHRMSKIVILFIPVSRLIYITSMFLHLPAIWWIFDCAIIGFAGIFLLIRLMKN